MAQRSQVPKIGNWESEEKVQYSEHFDNARKVKKDEKMNPNDPEDNPDIFDNSKPSIQAAPGQQAESEGREKPEVAALKHERQTSRDDGEIRRLTNSMLQSDAVIEKTAVETQNQHQGGEKSGNIKSESHALKVPEVSKQHEQQLSQEEGDMRRQAVSTSHQDTVGGRATDSPHHHHHGGSSAGGTPRRVARQGGPDRSLEHSPLHPNYQTKVGGKNSGVSSPSWERKGSSDGVHGQGSSTPGRSRLRSVTRGSDAPDESPAVPKFGDWDENDPSSAEGYTHIFNKVREEKQVGAGKVPVMPTETSYSNGQKRHGRDRTKSCWCLPWCRK